MKKYFSIPLACLITGAIYSQSFTEITETPFEEVYELGVDFADIDNDNDFDAVIGSQIFRNGGNGTFEFDTQVSGLEVYFNTFVDVDNDNDQDLIIAAWEYWGPWGYWPARDLFINDGNGNFELTTDPLPGNDYESGFMAIADTDNDNDQDILITGFDWGDPLAKLYSNDGSGSFIEVIGTPFEPVSGGSIVFSDIDSDDDQDVLITGMSESLAETAILYTNDGAGNFTKITGTPFEGVSGGSVAISAIVNGNSQDVLIMGHNGSELIARLYVNDGSGQFKLVPGTPFEGVDNSSIAICDVDKDNDNDVLISGYNGVESITKLYANHGNGVFTEVIDTPFEGVSGGSGVNGGSIAFADIDNDSDQDLLINGYGNSSLVVTKLYSNNAISALAFNNSGDNQDGINIEGLNPNSAIDQSFPKSSNPTESIEGNTLFRNVSIYPNPNQGAVNIDLGDLEDVSVSVFNMNGGLVYHEENITDRAIKFELNTNEGIYILELSTGNQKQHYKLVKQ